MYCSDCGQRLRSPAGTHDAKDGISASEIRSFDADSLSCLKIKRGHYGKKY